MNNPTVNPQGDTPHTGTENCELPADLLSLATQWVKNDASKEDAQTIEKLIAENNIDELASRFSGPLTFGTAGLRGQVGAGQTRMNRSVVAKATAGLIAYIHERLHEITGEISQGRVVIGHDARHGSADFARTAAEVISGAGGHAIALPSHLPTPLLAFAVRYLGADAGIMVTASHNPPADNGYKVYLGGRLATTNTAGVQIISPDDAAIAAAIGKTGPANQIPRTTDNIEKAGEEVRDAYLRSLLSLSQKYSSATENKDIAITLTPMHGVGGHTALMALERAGFTGVGVVKEQAEPDPEFPTVTFPNPEEPGALDCAKKAAKEQKADIIIALDPDADRCSVAIPNADKSDYRQLTGDEIGALLGDVVARAHTASTSTNAASPDGATSVSEPQNEAGSASGTEETPSAGVLASSIVSSRQLAAIARHRGLAYTHTLTGFKWIGRTEGLIFGYEEAIGYCTYPSVVRDKDGVSAALTIAHIVAQLSAQGRTIDDYLSDLARTHGLYATTQAAFRVEDISLIAKGMEALRTQPPSSFAGSPVTTAADLSEGYDGLAPTDGLLFLTEDNTRVICRPSGTEPKLKCYLEVVLPVESDATASDIDRVRAEASKKLEHVRQEITEATGF